METVKTMSHYSAKPLALDLRSSRQLAALLALAGVASLLLVCWLPLPATLRFTLVLLLPAATGYALLRDALRLLPWSVTALQLAGDGTLRYRTRDGRWRGARLLGDSCVTAWLTVLVLVPAGSRFARGVVLLPDSLGREDYRRLRIQLRWCDMAAAGGA